MTTKEWLFRARRLDREIDGLIEAKDIAWTRITSTTTHGLSSTPVSATRDPHKFDGYVELEAHIDSRIDELCRVKAEIQSAIDKLTDGRHRQVLTAYYVNGRTWEQVAVDMSYSWRHLMRLQKDAHRAIKDVIECHIAPVV